jgi:hypothetical protein
MPIGPDSDVANAVRPSNAAEMLSVAERQQEPVSTLGELLGATWRISPRSRNSRADA